MSAIYDWANLWSTCIEVLGDAWTPQGACCARKRPAKDGQEENRFGAWSFKPMRTHVMKLSAPCPVVKQKHDTGNTAFNTYPKIWSNDDRILLPKWLSFERLKYFENLGCVVKIPKSFGRTKGQNRKRVD